MILSLLLPAIGIRLKMFRYSAPSIPVQLQASMFVLYSAYELYVVCSKYKFPKFRKIVTSRKILCSQRSCFFLPQYSTSLRGESENPTIFLKACEQLDVKPEEAVHVGDDRRNDVWVGM